MSTLTLDLTSVSPDGGGVAVVAAGVAGGLSSLGQEHQCLVAAGSTTDWQHALDDSPLSEVRPVAVSLSSRSRWQQVLRRVVPMRLRPRRALVLLRRVRARSVAGTLSPGVVWSPFHRVPASGGGAAVVTVHDLRVFEDEWASPADRDIVRENIRRASALVCSWPHPREHLVELFPEVREKTFLAPLPAMHVGTFTDRLPSTGAPRLFYPAALTPHKNHETLVRAMVAMPTATLVCSGPAEARHETRMHALARDLGVSDRIRWRGFVSLQELEEEYAAADLLVMPSRWEAASGPVLEAVTRGLPSVVSDAAPLVRQQQELGTGAPSFAADDPDALAAAVADALDRYDELVDRLRPASERLRLRTWQDTAADYLAVFSWVAGDGPRPDHLVPEETAR